MTFLTLLKDYEAPKQCSKKHINVTQPIGAGVNNFSQALNCHDNEEEGGFHFPTPHERLGHLEGTDIPLEFLGWILLVTHRIWMGKCWVLLLFWSNKGRNLIKEASEP